MKIFNHKSNDLILALAILGILLAISMTVYQENFETDVALSSEERIIVSSLASKTVELFFSRDTSAFSIDNNVKIRIVEALPALITSKNPDVIRSEVLTYINNVRDRWVELEDAGVANPTAYRVALLAQRLQGIEHKINKLDEKLISKAGLRWMIITTFFWLLGAIMGIQWLYRIRYPIKSDNSE